MAKEDVGSLYNSPSPGISNTPPPVSGSTIMAPGVGQGGTNNDNTYATTGLPTYAYTPEAIASFNNQYLGGQNVIPPPTGTDIWGTGQIGVGSQDVTAWAQALQAFAQTGGYTQYGPEMLGQYTNYQYDPSMLGMDYAAAMQQYMDALSMYAKAIAEQQAAAAKAAMGVKPAGPTKVGAGQSAAGSAIPESPVKKLV